MLFFEPNARRLVPDCFLLNNFNIFDFFKGKQSGTSRWCQGVAGAPKKYRRLQKATQSYEMITTRTKALPPKRHKRPFRSHTSAKAPKTIFGLTAAHNLFSFVSIVVGIVGVVVVVVVVVAVVFVHPLSLSCAFADKGVQWNLVQNMPSAAGVEIKLQNKWGIHIYIKRQSNA